ncbi:hypothetical protein [Haladaptatus sp. DYF46]|uniref:helix-turn-helix domain-containing protein n=1 Tax=Haladaptatus sp. DYF46 TaxID=2886041 RepID=UPI001E60AB33
MFDTLTREIDLIERTLEVLLLVQEHEPIGIRRLSRRSGTEHHEVRSSLRVLEEDGYIESTPNGATTTLEAGTFLAEMDDTIDGVTAQIDSLPISLFIPTHAEH